MSVSMTNMRPAVADDPPTVRMEHAHSHAHLPQWRISTCANASRACACVHAGASAGGAAIKPQHGSMDMCACMCIELRASMCEGRRALSPGMGACTGLRNDIHGHACFYISYFLL